MVQKSGEKTSWGCYLQGFSTIQNGGCLGILNHRLRGPKSFHPQSPTPTVSISTHKKQFWRAKTLHALWIIVVAKANDHKTFLFTSPEGRKENGWETLLASTNCMIWNDFRWTISPFHSAFLFGGASFQPRCWEWPGPQPSQSEDGEAWTTSLQPNQRPQTQVVPSKHDPKCFGHNE